MLIYSRHKIEGFSGFADSEFSGKKECRGLSGWHVNMFIRLPRLYQNRSLGLVVNGRPRVISEAT